MANKQLEILLTAKDNASAAFRAVGNSAKSAGDDFTATEQKSKTFSKGYKDTLKTIRGFGKLYLMGEAVDSGIKLVSNGIKAYSSSIKEADAGAVGLVQTLHDIPMVGKLGGVLAGGLASIYDGITTGKWALRDLGEEAKEILHIQEEQTKWAIEHKERMKELGHATRDALFTTSVIGLSESQKKIKEVEYDLQKKTQASREKQWERSKSVGADSAKLRDEVKAEAAYEVSIATEAAAKIAEITKQNNIILESLYRDRANRISALIGGALVVDLNSQGRHFDAALVQLQVATRAKIASVDSSLEEQLRLHPEETDKLKSGAKREKGAIWDEQSAMVKSLRKSGSKSIDETLEDSKIFQLKQEILLGKEGAKEQLRLWGIEKEYRKEIEEVNNILKDSLASPTQRANAENRLAVLSRMRQKRMETPDHQQVVNPTLASSRFLTGVLESAKDNGMSQLLKAVEKQNKEAEKQTALLNKLYTDLEAALSSGTSLVPIKLRG